MRTTRHSTHDVNDVTKRNGEKSSFFVCQPTGRVDRSSIAFIADHDEHNKTTKKKQKPTEPIESGIIAVSFVSRFAPRCGLIMTRPAQLNVIKGYAHIIYYSLL